MSPGRQLLLDGFPPPKAWMLEGLARLVSGKMYQIMFYSQDNLGDSESAYMDKMYFSGFTIMRGTEIWLLFSELPIPLAEDE